MLALSYAVEVQVQPAVRHDGQEQMAEGKQKRNVPSARPIQRSSV